MKTIKKLSVSLIFPDPLDNYYRFDENYWLTDKLKQVVGLGKTNYTPPMSLLALAAVTPINVQLNIIDERLEKIDFNRSVDLVGISVVTRTAYRAYEIADKFRESGIKVVLGGIHPTIMPDEALQHADSIVRGEGESVWPSLLDDFSQGDLKPIYIGKRNQKFDTLPLPRRDLIKNPNLYLTTKVITATRGCPNSCSYCSAGFATGKKYRKREIRDIIREIESIRGNFVMFLDDNIGWDIEYAKDLFKAIKPLRIRWAGAISLPALEDEELVMLASKSGCVSLGVGFESIYEETLIAAKKHSTNKPDKYPSIIARLHEHGIPILGYFLLGFDQDTQDTFEELADFIEEHGIEMPSINILVPFPGTPLYRQLDKEGRILSKDWAKYDTAVGSVVYKPKHMTPEKLLDGYLWLTNRMYSGRSLYKRFSRVGKFNLVPLSWFIFNHKQRKGIESATRMHKPGED